MLRNVHHERKDSDVDWVKSQKKAFTGWMNANLSRRQIFVKDLATDLADGTVFINLAEILTGQSAGSYHKQPKFRVHKLENVDKALQLLRKNGIELHGLANEDVVDGKMKILLGSIWRLIRSFQLAKHNGRSRAGSRGIASTKEDLLAWVRHEVESYDIPAVKNFTSSFQDGKAILALVHKNKPDSVNWEEHNFDNHFDTVEKALDLCESELELPQLVDANEVALGLTDEQSMMTFLSIFRDAVGGDADALARASSTADLSKDQSSEDRVQELERTLQLMKARITALEEDADDNEAAMKQQSQQLEQMRDHQTALEEDNAELNSQLEDALARLSKYEGKTFADAETQTDRQTTEMSTQASQLREELDITYERIAQLEKEKEVLEKEANDAILAQVEEDGKRHALQVKLADAQMKLLESKNKSRPGGLFPPARHRAMSTMSTASEMEGYSELNAFITDVEDDVLDLKTRMANAASGDNIQVGPKLAAFMALSGRASPGSPLRLSTASNDELPDAHPDSQASKERRAAATSAAAGNEGQGKTAVPPSPGKSAMHASGSSSGPAKSVTLHIPDSIGSEMRDSFQTARAAAIAGNDLSPDAKGQKGQAAGGSGHAASPGSTGADEDEDTDDNIEIAIEEEPVDEKRKYRAQKRTQALEELASHKQAEIDAIYADEDMRRDRVVSDVSAFDVDAAKRGANPTATAFRQRKRELNMLKETKDLLDRERAKRKALDKENQRLRAQLRTAKKEAQLARMTPEERESHRAKVETDVDEFMASFLQQPAVLELLDSLPFKVESLGMGQYRFGTKKIHVFIIRNHAMVRIGGGYIKFEEFVEKHAIVESEKVRAIALKKGVGAYVPEEDKSLLLEEKLKYTPDSKWKEY
eukprot:TRINITY_DN4585_c0_g1_i1.p1 TRINITY_DN4585_c0_g1~~TRINITY_DN4585_c0_g1_i1.p1  ORF type:complete len:937 (-),score=265.93 TRINITY_DN4585_c0_g1_i1:101-2734(-)